RVRGDPAVLRGAGPRAARQARCAADGAGAAPGPGGGDGPGAAGPPAAHAEPRAAALRRPVRAAAGRPDVSLPQRPGRAARLPAGDVGVADGGDDGGGGTLAGAV